MYEENTPEEGLGGWGGWRSFVTAKLHRGKEKVKSKKKTIGKMKVKRRY